MRYRALYGQQGSRIRQWQTIQWKTGQWKTGQSAMADNIVAPCCQRMRLMPAYKNNGTSLYKGTGIFLQAACAHASYQPLRRIQRPFLGIKSHHQKKICSFFIFFLPSSAFEYINAFVVEVVELVDTLS